MAVGPVTNYVHQLAGVEDVHGFVTRVCFKTGPPGTVGLESESLVVDTADPLRRVLIPELRSALDGVRLPGASLVTYEPGGQLELSSAPAPDLSTVCRDLGRDLEVARAALAPAGLRLVAQGTDPSRTPLVQTLGPRYEAMSRFFANRGVAGEAMMSSTAALQLSLDAGRDETDLRRRWAVANALVPVLVATFANSPFRFGAATGTRSSRYAIWAAIDPGRTSAPVGPDPALAWTCYALDANVMLVRTPDSPWIADPGFTFGEWVSGRTSLPRPTEDDLIYHLTTLFPPVRPRGWFELRFLDALPEGMWQVAAAVTTALVEDERAGDAALEAGESVQDLIGVAIRDAVSDRRLQRAAQRCLDAALAALPELGAAALVDDVARFRELYTDRGRCPADDLLDPAGAPAGPAPDHSISTSGSSPLWP